MNEVWWIGLRIYLIAGTLPPWCQKCWLCSVDWRCCAARNCRPTNDIKLLLMFLIFITARPIITCVYPVIFRQKRMYGTSVALISSWITALFIRMTGKSTVSELVCQRDVCLPFHQRLSDFSPDVPDASHQAYLLTTLLITMNVFSGAVPGPD